MSIQYVKATKHHASQVRNLVVQLAIYEKYPDAVTATEEVYQEVLEQGKIHAFLAFDTHTESYIGLALSYFAFSTWKGKMLYLEDFFIEPSYRRKGIGQRLFDFYLQTAREMGCVLCKWEVLKWNKMAIDFYIKNDAMLEDEFMTVKKYL